MANDKVAIWNQTIKLGRPPANGELFMVKVDNGANAGTFALQFAESAATGTVTMEKGSWLEYRAI
jgi:hypothetical protein